MGDDLVHSGGGCDERGGQMRRRSRKTLGVEATAQTPLRIAAGLASRMCGLLFSPACPGTLLLVPCGDVHTVGMRHDLDIAFVDVDGVVVKACRDVGPMRRVRCRNAVATLERFSKREPWFEVGDRIGIGIVPDESLALGEERFKR